MHMCYKSMFMPVQWLHGRVVPRVVQFVRLRGWGCSLGGFRLLSVTPSPGSGGCYSTSWCKKTRLVTAFNPRKPSCRFITSRREPELRARGMSTERGKKRYLSQEEARNLDNELFHDYQFSIDQLMEVAGLCVAQAIAQCYPLTTSVSSEVGVLSSKVLVVCGPGNNGGDGLVAARHLLFMGYTSVIYYPKRTAKDIYRILVAQCEKLGISFLAELPSASEIDLEYRVVVDAIFGFSFKGSARAPFDSVLLTLLSLAKAAVTSVDVPSGWDVEKGDIDNKGLKPDLLISLTAPKECSRQFSGRHHYLGLRMVPPALAAKYSLDLPEYPGSDIIVKI